MCAKGRMSEDRGGERDKLRKWERGQGRERESGREQVTREWGGERERVGGCEWARGSGREGRGERERVGGNEGVGEKGGDVCVKRRESGREGGRCVCEEVREWEGASG